jgi:hypothetical protein
MEDSIKLISYVVLNYPKQVAKMLNDNGVVLEDASNFTTKQLSDATITGLTSSKKFNNDFVNYVQSLNVNSNFTGSDDFFNLSGDWANVLSSGIPALTKLFSANTDTKNLQAQLDAQNKTNETAITLKDKEIELAKLGLLASQNKLGNASTGKGGNTTLYVALGIGGALVLGLVIFLVTRKKS